MRTAGHSGARTPELAGSPRSAAMTFSIRHVSTSDYVGGAARAAYRIHRALVDAGHDSRMTVLHKSTDDVTVATVASSRSRLRRVAERLTRRFAERGRRAWHTDNTNFHSFGNEGTPVVSDLHAGTVDVVHLHWIPRILSIADIGLIRRPIVWTLHDMWPFCGAEHYAPDGPEARFRHGYTPATRPSGERGPDVNRRVWLRKQSAWADRRFTIVSPSTWLADCAAQSTLFSRCDVRVIPYPLDVFGIWQPTSRRVAREALRLPPDPRLILFASAEGVADRRKGADLLRDAIAAFAERKTPDVELMIVGQERPTQADAWPIPVNWLGQVRDDRVLALAYAAADVVVVPSRQDNLPNIAIEAHACGTPVVGFRIGGLPDIVQHQQTGWLATPFDARDLEAGIEWVISDPARHAALSETARRDAMRRYDPRVIAEQYQQIYATVRRTARDAANCHE